ncbi:MAG: hypothetical protein L3J53_06870 [Proteobacteria bacterium]|nr:hypothetical protein [Pseudomonadota bacterium]
MIQLIGIYLKKLRLLFTQYNLFNVIYYFRKSINNQQLYIHIGMPKTGSSAIQAFLSLNKRYLKKHGFSYPNNPGFNQAFQTSSGNAVDVFTWIKNNNTDIFKKYLKKANARHVILSSEILYGALKENPEKFANYFSKYNYKIICYIRDYGDLMESCVNQQIKNQNLVDYININKIDAAFNYYNCLIKAINYIDPDRIIVKKYGRKYFYKGDIYTDFMNIFGLDLDKNIVSPIKIVNPSLNRDALEFRILLNKSLFAQKDVKLKYAINGLLASYSVACDSDFGNNYHLLSPKLRESLSLKYSKLEKQINKIFFHQENSRIFDSTSLQYKAYNGLSTGSITKILSFVKQNNLQLYDKLIAFVVDEMKNPNDREKILLASELV